VKYDITCTKKNFTFNTKQSDIETFGGGIIAAFISLLSLVEKRRYFSKNDYVMFMP
jgi:hypothetical protein